MGSVIIFYFSGQVQRMYVTITMGLKAPFDSAVPQLQHSYNGQYPCFPNKKHEFDSHMLLDNSERRVRNKEIKEITIWKIL